MDIIDLADRERFERNLSENLSLVCPAGSGKTHAITQRVSRIACHNPLGFVPERMAVLTFTVAAAKELRERCLTQCANNDRAKVLADRMFFGTIHSFVGDALRRYGARIGLSDRFEITENAAQLWTEFLADAEIFAGPCGAVVARHMAANQIITMAQTWDFSRSVPSLPSGDEPAISCDAALEVPTPKRRDWAASLEIAKQQFRSYAEQWNSAKDWVPLTLPDRGGAAFLSAARDGAKAAHDWLATAAACVAHDLALRARKFRAGRGSITFDDVLSLGVELLRDEATREELRGERWSFLLDEAQDTDPIQFDFLIELSRPKSAPLGWRDAEAPAEQGRFCMVGDAQQSIYSSRADPATYSAARAWLIRSGGAELTFASTFRCGEKIVDFVNGVFAPLLTGEHGQAAHVRMTSARADAPSRCIRLDLTHPDITEPWVLAEKLATEGPAAVGAAAWSEVAVLFARKSWGDDIADALRHYKLPYRNLSPSDTPGRRPALHWLAGAAAVTANPSDAFEVVGMLREVFGISDVELARVSALGFDLLSHDATRNDEVGKALTLMRECSDATGAGPCSQLLVWVDRIIRSSLTAVADVFPGALTDLDGLLEEAAKAEAAGLSMGDFAAAMRVKVETGNAVAEDVEGDAITLLSAHKSKGLQFPVVVIPFLRQPIGNPPSFFPRLLGAPGSTARYALLGAYAAEEGSGRAAETIRLAYVAMTRAQSTLVLCDSPAEGRSRFPSFADLLLLDESEAWAGVSPSEDESEAPLAV